MNITFDTRLRVPFPEPDDLSLQSFYIFNLYRAGSSVLEAAAESFANMSRRTPNNVTRILYDARSEFVDNHDYSKPVIYLADQGASLLRLCEVGGWLNYGFREVPLGFSSGFTQIGATLLIVRDPRDIGISHFHALAKHDDTHGVYGDHIRQARATAADKGLTDYLLSDELIGFLTRICEGYRPMIQRGMPVVHYEDLFLDGEFSVALLCKSILERFSAYDDGSWSLERFVEDTQQRIRNSKALQGHATGGSTKMYLALPDAVRDAYSERLRSSLEILGY